MRRCRLPSTNQLRRGKGVGIRWRPEQRAFYAIHQLVRIHAMLPVRICQWFILDAEPGLVSTRSPELPRAPVSGPTRRSACRASACAAGRLGGSCELAASS